MPSRAALEYAELEHIARDLNVHLDCERREIRAAMDDDGLTLDSAINDRGDLIRSLVADIGAEHAFGYEITGIGAVAQWPHVESGLRTFSSAYSVGVVAGQVVAHRVGALEEEAPWVLCGNTDGLACGPPRRLGAYAVLHERGSQIRNRSTVLRFDSRAERDAWVQAQPAPDLPGGAAAVGSRSRWVVRAIRRIERGSDEWRPAAGVGIAADAEAMPL